MDNPPSYDEAIKAPSAPMMEENLAGPSNPGWNPNMYPTPNQPQQTMVVQPQLNQPQTQLQAPVVIISQQIQLGNDPVSLICPHCKEQTLTKLHYTTNWLTHACACLICVSGWCLCSIIPYFTNCLKDVSHHCVKCNGYIGTFKRRAGC